MACSKAPAGGFGEPAALPSGWASGRRRWRHAWPSSGSSGPRSELTRDGLSVESRRRRSAGIAAASRRQRQVFFASAGNGRARERRRPRRRWPRLRRPPRCRRRWRPGRPRRRPCAPSSCPRRRPWSRRNRSRPRYINPPNADGVQLQRDLVAALHRPRLLHLHGLHDGRGAARNDDAAADHHRVVDDGLERHAGLASVSTSMAWARRTLIVVPAGTVTATGRGAGARAAAGPRPAPAPPPGPCAAVNSMATASVSGTSETCPSLEQQPHGLAVAANEDARHDFARSQADAVGRQRDALPSAASIAETTTVRRMFMVVRPSLDDGKRRRDLQVDQQQELVFDLQEAQRRPRGQRLLDLLVARGLGRPADALRARPPFRRVRRRRPRSSVA